jgi:uncharacterized protein YukE
MSLTHNLTREATTELQHATANIRRLTVLASMGAHPTREDYAELHRQATELNRAFKQLIQTLKITQAYEEETPNPPQNTD